MKTLSNIKPVSWGKPALYGLMLIGLYYSSLTVMISWWGKDDYSYCYLIPFILLYLIWGKRDMLASLPSVPSWTGLLPFVLGIAFFALGELGGEYFTLYISFWLVMVGLCWMHLGWEKLKAIAFPLLLSLTMFPFPAFLHNKISLNLKLISSQLGVALMHIYGMSAHQDGNIIDLGFIQLQVVDACSGLRYLFPLIVLGILLAYFFHAAFWKRAILVISAVPLSIIANSLRIALTGILYEVWGARIAEGFFHGFSGWFIFLFSMGALLVEMWILKKVQGSKQQKAGKLGGQEAGKQESIQKSKFKIQNFLSPPQFIVAVVLLGATLILSQGIEFREKIPINKSFEYFPLKVGEWTGVREYMEQKYIDALDLTDYVVIDFKDSFGRTVNFYVAYYESQRKGESIHSPETCLPGSGWIFSQNGEITLSSPGYHSGSITVNRSFMQNSSTKQLSYYWFPQRGRILTNAYQLKIFAFWDALTKQRTDGALVRLITPLYTEEGIKEAEKRLQNFTRKVLPLLEEFIPN